AAGRALRAPRRSPRSSRGRAPRRSSAPPRAAAACVEPRALEWKKPPCRHRGTLLGALALLGHLRAMVGHPLLEELRGRIVANLFFGPPTRPTTPLALRHFPLQG